MILVTVEKCLVISPRNDLPTLVCTFLLYGGLNQIIFHCLFLRWCGEVHCSCGGVTEYFVEVPLVMYVKFVVCPLRFRGAS